MESLTLTTAQVTTITTTTYHVERIVLQRFPTWLINVAFVGTNGERAVWTVGLNGDQARAQTLIDALNTVNLNPATGGKSLERRCIEQAQADGALPAGAVTGTPD